MSKPKPLDPRMPSTVSIIPRKPKGVQRISLTPDAKEIIKSKSSSLLDRIVFLRHAVKFYQDELKELEKAKEDAKTATFGYYLHKALLSIKAAQNLLDESRAELVVLENEYNSQVTLLALFSTTNRRRHGPVQRFIQDPLFDPNIVSLIIQMQ